MSGRIQTTTNRLPQDARSTDPRMRQRSGGLVRSEAALARAVFIFERLAPFENRPGGAIDFHGSLGPADPRSRVLAHPGASRDGSI